MNDETLDAPGTLAKRRRDLLPVWIRIFIWLFLITGGIALLMPVAGLFVTEVQLALYGIETTDVYHPVGLGIVGLFVYKGVVAFGLWFEKSWAPALAIVDAVLGIGICLYVMLIYRPVIVQGNSISIRLELIVLIPYLIKMLQIRKPWREIG